MTAMPKPLEEPMSLEMAMNEQVPKKLERRMFDVKIDANSRVIGST
jgi:hypothetical protein